ncbi:RNA polymerase sigma factor [Mucilaginibacter paludis]|uniref:Sigma-70 region 2 domain protein n=1 Tax=Mucilaginibacter paludis DSM 18603 TaxID=714943 RepID=H1YBQ5_9SPHI|nr:sigma factor [Mucilaginibacter paludis]EHQ26018.1 sigma-70 region 2 domain protein [Mucilaginibacter paludis DSM 18603]
MAKCFSDVSDAQLLQNWRNGDARAFDQLFERYFYQLFRFALTYMGDASLAEEMIMDVLLKLWQKKELLQDQSLSPFFFHLLKSKVIDHYRKKKLEFS